MRKVILGVGLVMASVPALAKPPLPDFFPTNPDDPIKNVCDTMAKMSVEAYKEKVEGISLENMQERLEANKGTTKPYKVYLLETATTVGYNSNSKQSAYDESWGHCYRYLFFQE